MRGSYPIPFCLEVFEGIRHFDNLKCQSLILWQVHRNLHEICLFGFSKLLNRNSLWTLANSTNQNLNNRLVIYPFHYKLGGSGDCTVFTQKNEQRVFQACYKVIFPGKKENGIILGLMDQGIPP